MAKKRLGYLDSIGGMLILFMVIEHIAGQYGRSDLQTTPVFRALFFYMFWFFFKGGMLFSPGRMASVLSKGARRLLVPLCVWTVIGMAVYWAVYFPLGKPLFPEGMRGAVTSLLKTATFSFQPHLWFLPALFATRALYAGGNFLRFGDKSMAAAGFSLAALLHYGGDDLRGICPTYVETSSLGLGCFALGHCLNRVQYGWRTGGAAAAVFGGILALYPSTINFSLNRVVEGSYPLGILFSLAGCILANNLFSLFRKGIPLLHYIGSRSMAWYVVHWPAKFIGGIIADHIPFDAIPFKSLTLHTAGLRIPGLEPYLPSGFWTTSLLPGPFFLKTVTILGIVWICVELTVRVCRHYGLGFILGEPTSLRLRKNDRKLPIPFR